jgi:hypothetical protein
MALYAAARGYAGTALNAEVGMKSESRVTRIGGIREGRIESAFPGSNFFGRHAKGGIQREAGGGFQEFQDKAPVAQSAGTLCLYFESWARPAEAGWRQSGFTIHLDNTGATSSSSHAVTFAETEVRNFHIQPVSTIPDCLTGER